jgi:parallel beta-helix repeat protein
MSQTVYVSTTGSDRNPGTIDRPFRTVTAAVRSLPPEGGGNVLLRGGTYVLDKPIRISGNEGGNAASPLVISNYGGEKVVLDGTALAPEKLGAVIITSARYVEVKGLEVIGSYTGITALGDSQNIKILNNTVHDTQFTGIAAYGTGNGLLRDVTIDGNTVYRTNLFNRDRPIEQPTGWGMGITLSQTEGGAITNNISYENYGEGIGLTLANGAVVSNNIAYDNFSVQLYLDNARDAVLENNFAYNSGNREFYRRYPNTEVAAAGILLANEDYNDPESLRNSNSLNNNIIRNNVIVGGDSVIGYGGFEDGGGLRNIAIVNNTFYANSTSRKVLDIDPDNHENTLVANNIFYGDRTNPVELPGVLTGLTFRNNLWSGVNPGQAANVGDVNGDPLFLNPGGIKPADYQLIGNSPAVDRGFANPLTGVSFGGGDRNQGAAPDIGAQEFNPLQSDRLPPKRLATATTDFSGDRIGDALSYDFRTGAVSLWQLGDGGRSRESAAITLDRSWDFRGLTDLNGDGNADALWQNSRSGALAGWLLGDGQIQQANFINIAGSAADATGWQIIGYGDFNQDAKSDIVWRHSSTQSIVTWLMDGTTVISASSLAALSAPNWQLADVADFDADGQTDLLWHQSETGVSKIWLMDSDKIRTETILPTRSTPFWQVAAVADLTGDGRSDILWSNQRDGRVQLWSMDGSTITQQSTLRDVSDRDWQIVGVDDFVGGAAADLLWQNTRTGSVGLWEISGGNVAQTAVLAAVDPSWQIAATKDVTGDRKADVTWRNDSLGAVSVWRFGLNPADNQITWAANGGLIPNLNPALKSYF